MHRRLIRALTSIREHGSVRYAKIATMGGFCDLYCIITKATSPDNTLLSERYINQLLKHFSISPSSSFRSFSLGFSRRFMNTQCWRVALKCLILLHRLLRALPEDSPFRGEISWTRSKGLLCLSPCGFIDSSSSLFSEDYTEFVRSYANLLDEALDCFSICGEDTKEGELMMMVKEDIMQEKMKEFGRLIESLPQLQSLIDGVLDCQPTAVATKNILVQSALKLVIRDSFMCYTCFRRELVVVLESLFQLPYRSCITAFNIFKKAAVQTNQLSEFYNWCKYMGIFCEICEYPCLDKIPEIQVLAVEKLMKGMWELTESLSSSTASTQLGSPWRLIEEGSETCLEIDVPSNWEKFEDDFSEKKVDQGKEMEPLIRFDEVEDVNWEALLEASIDPTFIAFQHNSTPKFIYDSGDRYKSIND